MGLPIPKGFTPEHLLKEMKKAKKSGQYYYNEEYARHAQKILDTLHTQGETLFISSSGSNVNTLRVQYYQGKDYLLDNLDPDGKYKHLSSLTEVKARQDGVSFIARKSPKGKATLADFVTVIPKWREQVEEFLDNAGPNQKLSLEGLFLNEKDIQWINGQLAGLIRKDEEGNEIPVFFGEVTTDKILLIRDDI